jgi:hypothetical protein
MLILTTKFRVVCSSKATSSASGGGSSVTAAFQINTGLNTYMSDHPAGVQILGDLVLGDLAQDWDSQTSCVSGR